MTTETVKPITTQIFSSLIKIGDKNINETEKNKL